MMQESVYVKLKRNKQGIEKEIHDIKERTPKGGNVKALILGLTEFGGIINITGEAFRMNCFADDVAVA